MLDKHKKFSILNFRQYLRGCLLSMAAKYKPTDTARSKFGRSQLKNSFYRELFCLLRNPKVSTLLLILVNGDYHKFLPNERHRSKLK